MHAESGLEDYDLDIGRDTTAYCVVKLRDKGMGSGGRISPIGPSSREPNTVHVVSAIRIRHVDGRTGSKSHWQTPSRGTQARLAPVELEDSSMIVRPSF